MEPHPRRLHPGVAAACLEAREVIIHEGRKPRGTRPFNLATDVLYLEGFEIVTLTHDLPGVRHLAVPAVNVGTGMPWTRIGHDIAQYLDALETLSLVYPSVEAITESAISGKPRIPEFRNGWGKGLVLREMTETELDDIVERGQPGVEGNHWKRTVREHLEEQRMELGRYWKQEIGRMTSAGRALMAPAGRAYWDPETKNVRFKLKAVCFA